MFNTLSKHLRTVAGKPVIRRILIGLGIFMLVFNLFAFVALPAIVKSQAQQLAADKLHRQLTLGRVEINPYAMRLTVRDLKLMEPEGNAVFAAFDVLTVNLSYESIFQRAPVVQELRLTKPYVHLVRSDAHSYNISDILGLIAAQPPSEQPARFSINNIQVDGGRVEFEDKPGRARHTVADLTLGVPFVSSLPSDVTVFVEPLLSARVNDTPLLLKGKARPFADPKDAVLELALRDHDLTRYLEYLPLRPGVKIPSARLDLHLIASFQQSRQKAPAFAVSGDIALKSMEIIEANGKPLLKLPELSVNLRDMNVFGNRFDLARLALTGLEANIHRDSNGRLNILDLIASQREASASQAVPAAEPSALRIGLGEVEVRRAAVRYTDDRQSHPLHANVEKFDLGLRKLELDTATMRVAIAEVTSGNASILLRQGKPAAKASELETGSKAVTQDRTVAGSDSAYRVSIGRLGIDNWSARLEDHRRQEPAVMVVAPLSLSMQNLDTASSASGRMEFKANVNKTGQIGLSGSVGIAPFHTDLAMELNNVDILPLQPYITDQLNLRVTRASLSGKGRLQLDLGPDGGIKGSFKGDTGLNDVAMVDKSNGEDFLRWKSLSFGGTDVRFEPFALTVDNVTLSDFFARVIIDSRGRINLQDVARGQMADRKSLTEPPRDAAAPPQPVPVKSDRAATGVSADKKAPVSPVTPVTIRKLHFEKGRVRFTDNFIKPNYSASLINIGGAVTGLSSDASSSASVDLRGEVNDAPLSVAGRINPLKRDLLLDIKASVRGMELAPLSAYSARYVGYGIEKGKLSFDIRYRVEDRQLTAENRLILNQLTFGEESNSPDTKKLPVRFALALLRDRDGVVDINVPVGGSLDDPQFSIGGIIFKVIGNTIAKAISQPFALLGSLFGGGEELSSLGFDPGRSAVPPAGEAKLKSLAKALSERPALQLEITGRVDPQADPAGLKRASIDRKVRALKWKDLTARGESADAGRLTVKANEYPALLARVYKDEKIDKPRNILGLQKDLPVDEMEKLLIANAVIDDDDLVALGNRRAQAVKDWLLKFGQVSGERIFILASRPAGQAGQGSSAESPATRVDFSLR